MPEEQEVADKNEGVAERLDSLGWALFFIWVGTALLLDVGWTFGLLGVGVIILGEQAARWYCGLRLESLWVVIGLVVLIGGFWELLEIEIPLLPVLMIAAGVAVLIGALGAGRWASRSADAPEGE